MQLEPLFTIRTLKQTSGSRTFSHKFCSYDIFLVNQNMEQIFKKTSTRCDNFYFKEVRETRSGQSR